MQIDVKLLPHFDFNRESEQGSLIASINNANKQAQGADQAKKVDFSLISKLLAMQVPQSEASSIAVEKEEEFLA